MGPGGGAGGADGPAAHQGPVERYDGAGAADAPGAAEDGVRGGPRRGRRPGEGGEDAGGEVGRVVELADGPDARAAGAGDGERERRLRPEHGDHEGRVRDRRPHAGVVAEHAGRHDADEGGPREGDVRAARGEGGSRAPRLCGGVGQVDAGDPRGCRGGAGPVLRDWHSGRGPGADRHGAEPASRGCVGDPRWRHEDGSRGVADGPAEPGGQPGRVPAAAAPGQPGELAPAGTELGQGPGRQPAADDAGPDRGHGRRLRR